MKTKILAQLQYTGLPDFQLFTAPEALSLFPQLLEELLAQDQAVFYSFLEKQDQDLIFEDFIPISQLDYLWKVLNHLDSVDANQEIRTLISSFRPQYEDFLNEVAYSQGYYQKLLWAQAHLEQTEDQKRWFELQIKAYQQRGIHLPLEQQEELKAINKQLSSLGELFQHHVVDEQSAFRLFFDDEKAFEELPKNFLALMRELAGEEGNLAINADPTLFQAVLKYCSDSEIRKKLSFQKDQWASSGVFDNRPLVLELLDLSQKKAKLLGYPHAAGMFLWDTMAQKADEVYAFLKLITEKAQKKAQAELETLKSFFHLEELQSWDLAYYSRKYKEEQFAFDEEELRAYFEFEAVLKWLHDFVFRFF